MAETLKDRRKQKKKKKTATSKYIFLPAESMIHFPLYKWFYSLENTSENAKGQHFSVTQKNSIPPTPGILYQVKIIPEAKPFKNFTHFPGHKTNIKQ